MSTDLVAYETPEIDDGWSDAAEDASERILRGTLLKFADWRWTAGQDARPLEKGTRLVAIGTAAAWVRWWDGKPVQYEIRRSGEHWPTRNELGDIDEANWQAGPDGKPRDPWQNTRFVYFVHPGTAEAFTFSTSSAGGRGAVSDLGEQIHRMRFSGRRGAVPLVELDAAPMKTKFGNKSKPWLKVIEWVGGAVPPRQIEHVPAKAAQPVQQQQVASPELQRAMAEERRQQHHDHKPPPRGDMNDEIPF